MKLEKISFGGIIEITHDKPSGFKVSGPADDDIYTVRFIQSKERAVIEADSQAQRKANDSGDRVAVKSYIDHKPIQSIVVPAWMTGNVEGQSK